MIEPTDVLVTAGSCFHEMKKPFTFFIHREDSEPERVASRNRLAPTQPLTLSTTAATCPIKSKVNRSNRSEPKLFIRSLATVVADRCDFASRSAYTLVDTQKRQHLGGRQTDGFRRTIGYEKNQRGVREYLT